MVNILWWKLYKKLLMNTMLNLKTRFERKRSALNKWNVVSILVQMFFQSARCIFTWLIFFQAPSSIFVLVTFTEVLMKDLSRTLIHRVFFKMLLSMCLVIVEKGLSEHSCNQVTFGMPVSKKITITLTEVILLQVSFFTILF